MSPQDDPRGQLDALGALWSKDFDEYASGRLSVSQVRCVLCQHAPCDCPEFGSPEYLTLIRQRHPRRRATWAPDPNIPVVPIFIEEAEGDESAA